MVLEGAGTLRLVAGFRDVVASHQLVMREIERARAALEEILARHGGRAAPRPTGKERRATHDRRRAAGDRRAAVRRH